MLIAVSPCIHWVNLSSLKFWMYCREDLRKLKRITLLWDYIRSVSEQNQGLLMGESREMLWCSVKGLVQSPLPVPASTRSSA